MSIGRTPRAAWRDLLLAVYPALSWTCVLGTTMIAAHRHPVTEPVGPALFFVPPPYRVSTAVARVRSTAAGPGLGVIAMSNDRDLVRGMGSIVVALHRWPWLAPCIALTRNQLETEAWIQFVFPEPARLAICRAPESGGLPQPSTVVGAVAGRDPPTPELMARYVAHRLSAPHLLGPVADQFRLALGNTAATDRSTATYSRLFAKYGPLTAHDWRAIARLVYRICAIGSTRTAVGKISPREGQEPLASKTVVHHVGRYLGLQWRAAVSLTVWEAVMEQALRVGGYVGGTIAPRVRANVP